MATPVNATGWAELMDGQMVAAAYTVFDTAFGGVGLIAVILFMVFEIMLYRKTQSLTSMFIIGMIFTSLYATSQFYEPLSLKILFGILVLELAGILYMFTLGKKGTT